MSLQDAGSPQSMHYSLCTTVSTRLQAFMHEVHLYQRVALCNGHAVFAVSNGGNEALQARGVGRLVGGGGAGLKREVLSQAGSVHIDCVLLELPINHLDKHSLQ